LTWIIVNRKYDEQGEADAVKSMVRWMLTDGQELNDDLGFTRVPESIANRVIQAVNTGVTGL
jgi:phosphate transport system substrate-binding protein